jgi:CDP-glucose 4,6-dehydratase
MELLEFFCNKSVLVTGHTGFKGSWLTRILVQAGAKVTGYSLEPSTNPALFDLTGDQSKIKSIIADIRDLDA